MIFTTITRKGYARLNRSHVSTGLIVRVPGRDSDTERYTDVSTIIQVMLMVKIRSY